MKQYQINLFLLIIYGFLACNNDKAEPVTAAPQYSTDKIALADLSGAGIDLKKFRGKAVFINFWATWCNPCLREMPSIQNASRILKSDSVVFLLASTEDAATILEFQNKSGYDFQFCKVQNAEELFIDVLPTTYIFDKKGNLVFSEVGFKRWDDEVNLEIIRKAFKDE